ncbi:hypothetical protein H072_608 [Dactylellina haptotyla CBS 200.50]|uniref:Uncharacterized protein n=1 Tax=Dactylellina haptotyla (strain CBS 200.50) TaxID=1284197 RepID=S8ARD7_DACHA|nr:hypothetical protein H072_608 [Dactylellina haptotyla CBS 200.50]
MDVFNVSNQLTTAHFPNASKTPTEAVVTPTAAITPSNYLLVWIAVQLFCALYLGGLVNRLFTSIGLSALGTLFDKWISWYHSMFGLVMRYGVVPFFYNTNLPKDKIGGSETWTLIFGAGFFIGRYWFVTKEGLWNRDKSREPSLIDVAVGRSLSPSPSAAVVILDGSEDGDIAVSEEENYGVPVNESNEASASLDGEQDEDSEESGSEEEEIVVVD